MADIPQKPNRPQYVEGSLLPQNKIKEIKTVGQQGINQELKGKTEEEKTDALESGYALASSAQKDILQAPEQQRAAVAEEKAGLIDQRAKIEGRGLSTGEKIAMAILRAAPIVAASLTPGADLRGAQQGSRQIGQDFNAEMEAQRKRELDAVDARLGALSEEDKVLLRQQERGEDRGFQEKMLDKRFNQEKYLEGLKAGNKNKDDFAKEEKYAQTKAKMFTGSQQYKDAIGDLKNFDKGFTALKNSDSNGYSDIAAMFNFVKGLDNSVVRPSEIELFNEARSLADRATGFVKNKQTGEIFLQENREKLARVQKLLAQLPTRVLERYNSKATEGEEPERAEKIKRYLTTADDILSPTSVKALKEEKIKRLMELEAKEKMSK